MSAHRFGKLSRRDILRGAAGAGAAALAGCAVPIGGPGSGNKISGLCATGDVPTWDEVRQRIKRVVVLCMENRSFDHYFGALKLEEGLPVEGLSGNEVSLGNEGTSYAIHRLDHFAPFDMPHHWDRCQEQFARGTNSGFATAAQFVAREFTKKLQKKIPEEQWLRADDLAHRMAADSMGYYTRDDIPYFYALADSYALCEQWHSSVLGPTWTNRFYLHGATSYGLKDNTALVDIPQINKVKGILHRSKWESILDVLEGKNDIQAVNYYHDVAFIRAINVEAEREARFQFRKMTNRLDSLRVLGRFDPKGFFEAAEANTIPPFAFIDPHYGTFNGRDANDDHPDPTGGGGHHVQMGQALIASVVAALSKNPDTWRETLLVITYDEHGGFYDHVAPPETHDVHDDFRQLGFRVPALLVSPYVHQGCAVPTQLEHVSILKSVLNLFAIPNDADRSFADPNVRARIDAANDLLACFDRNALTTDRVRPPASLPEVRISLRGWRERSEEYGYHDELKMMAVQRFSNEAREAAQQEGILEKVLEWGEELGAVRMT